MDTLSPERRTENMRRIKSTDTAPELAVRRLLHRLGFRYRLHGRDLPGCPDLVFAGRRKVIFVHGCFWHGHSCRRGHQPHSNRDYWSEKLANNMKRDARNLGVLAELGWKTITVWECEVRSDDANLTKRLTDFLDR